MLKFFPARAVREAYAYSLAGGVALHDNPLAQHWPGAPACFKRSPRAGHLMDQDKERLIANARRFGVRKIVVSAKGTKGQHVDLCGKPYERALAECVDEPAQKELAI